MLFFFQNFTQKHSIICVIFNFPLLHLVGSLKKFLKRTDKMLWKNSSNRDKTYIYKLFAIYVLFLSEVCDINKIILLSENKSYILVSKMNTTVKLQIFPDFSL
jgi:hypothetical protein